MGKRAFKDSKESRESKPGIEPSVLVNSSAFAIDPIDSVSVTAGGIATLGGIVEGYGVVRVDGVVNDVGVGIVNVEGDWGGSGLESRRGFEPSSENPGTSSGSSSTRGMTSWVPIVWRRRSSGVGVFRSGGADGAEIATVASRSESSSVGGVGKVEDKSSSSKLELTVGKSINQPRFPKTIEPGSCATALVFSNLTFCST